MDPDLNKYDLEHVVTDHPKMTRAEWQAIYNEAWTLYYSRAHLETLMRRAAACGTSMWSLAKVLVPFTIMVPLENVHPLQAGLVRLKRPSERRYGLPRESVLSFYPRFIANLLWKNWQLLKTIAWIIQVKRRIERDLNHRSYMDEALRPVAGDDEERLDLLTKTTGARAAIDHQKKVFDLAHAKPVVAAE
jgi:hypothetical protein